MELKNDVKKYLTCGRCGIADALVLDLDTGGAYHPELAHCITALKLEVGDLRAVSDFAGALLASNKKFRENIRDALQGNPVAEQGNPVNDAVVREVAEFSVSLCDNTIKSLVRMGCVLCEDASVYTSSANGDLHAKALGESVLILRGIGATTLCGYCGEPRCNCWRNKAVTLVPEPTLHSTAELKYRNCANWQQFNDNTGECDVSMRLPTKADDTCEMWLALAAQP